MKKLMPLMVLALIVLFGCAKEETTPTVADNQQVDESSVWIINTNSDSPVWKLVTLDELPSNSATSATSRSNSSHTHGSVGTSLEWSGTENNGGPHGSAYWAPVFGPPGTPITEITMETECVMAEENEAVYGGIITEVLNNPFPPGVGPTALGNHVYFQVIDNGQGNNAPLDQYHPVIISSPISRCGIFTPSANVWNNFPLSLIFDVQEPGSVKVNN